MSALVHSPQITEIDLCAWLSEAPFGDALEYHRGFLVIDTDPRVSGLAAPARLELVQLAQRAFWASEQRLVHLVQRRLGENCFSYLAVARSRPKIYARQQPETISERTGKPDTRGAYGLLGREVIQALKHLQHAPGKTVIFVGVLEKVTDELNDVTWQPQMEGSKVGRELPGIVDQVISLQLFSRDEKGNPAPGRGRIRDEAAPAGARARLLQHLAEDGRGVRRHGGAGACADAASASVSRCDQPDGGNVDVAAVARADRCKDPLAACYRNALEADLLAGGSGTRGGARAFSLCAVRHRLAAQRSAEKRLRLATIVYRSQPGPRRAASMTCVRRLIWHMPLFLGHQCGYISLPGRSAEELAHSRVGPVILLETGRWLKVP
jgi:hypothetical protein